tara:strand:+ start:577 stop:681 length:105 start_codon:yes stop_codon:yes gene_type:complete
MATDVRIGTITPSAFAVGAASVSTIYLGLIQVYP